MKSNKALNERLQNRIVKRINVLIIGMIAGVLLFIGVLGLANSIYNLSGLIIASIFIVLGLLGLYYGAKG